MIISLCAQFSCLPSQLDKEDAQILRLLEIIRLGKKEGGEETSVE